MEIGKNGNATQPAMVTTSWVRDEFANGRKRFKLYAMHVPVTSPPVPLSLKQLSLEKVAWKGEGEPGMAGAPTVIGEASIEVPNLEVARILHAAIGQMLAAQPPEILRAAP